LPSLSYIRKGRTILAELGSCCSLLLLSVANKWHQICTDASSVGNRTFQDVILSVAEDDAFRPVLLTATAVLENGESGEAVSNTVVSTIMKGNKTLRGLKELAQELYPEEEWPYGDGGMDIIKLAEAHFTSDTCDGARKSIREIQKKVSEAFIAAAKQTIDEWMSLAPSGVSSAAYIPYASDHPKVSPKMHTIRCHNHLRNVWEANVIKACNAVRGRVEATLY